MIYIYGVYTHTQWYITAIKVKWNIAICSNIDGPKGYHSKLSKSDRERQILCDITYMWNLKKIIQMNLHIKQTDLTDIENKLIVTKGENCER